MRQPLTEAARFLPGQALPTLLLALCWAGCQADERATEPDGAKIGSDASPPEMDAGLPADLGDVLCRPGDVICDEEGQLLLCSPDGMAWQPERCPEGMACRDGRCLTQVCRPGAFRCANETNRLECAADGVSWQGFPCASGEVCLEGICQSSPCHPGETRCADPSTVETCVDHGTAWSARTCPSGTVCSQGSCHRVVCASGARRCSADSSAEEHCTDFGSRWESVPCGEEAVCTVAGLEAACTPRLCMPGEVRCAADDPQVREVCAEPGTQWAKQPCEGGWLCLDGSCRPLVCVPGSSRCEGPDRMGVCNAEGTGWSTVRCPGRQVCDWTGRCQEMICPPGDSHCADEQTVSRCNESGTARELLRCGEGMRCSEDRCRPLVCTPGEQRCLDLRTREECLPDGTGWSPFFCDGGASCLCEGNSSCEARTCTAQRCCAPQECQPGSSRCLDERRISVCSLGGTYATVVACGQDSICEEGACRPVVCQPGETTCLDVTRQGSCRESGTGFDFERLCDPSRGETCRSGRCISRCEELALQGASSGCEFLGVVPGAGEFGAGEATLLLINLEQVEAVVLLELAGEQQVMTVQPSRTQAVPVPPTLDERASTVSGSASFRLTSSIPVAAALELRSSDAGAPRTPAAASTLLLPLHAWGRSYRVPAFPADTEEEGAAATITVMASPQGATVRVLPSAEIGAGEGMASIPAGEERELVLGPSAVLLLRAASFAGDLSGTRIVSTAPVAVYTGTTWMDGPRLGACCDDRVLEQIPPLHALGCRHLLVGQRQGGQGEGAVQGRFRVLAAAGQVRLDSLPRHPALPAVLDEGRQLELATSTDLLLQSDGPVLVTQLLPSGGGAAGSPRSPAAVIVPPSEQWLQRNGVLISADSQDNEVVLVTRGDNPVEWRGGRDGVRILDMGWEPLQDGFATLRLAGLEPRLHLFQGLAGSLAVTVTVTSPAGRSSSRVAGYSVQDLGLFAPP